MRLFGRVLRDRGDVAARLRPFIPMMYAQRFGNRYDADGLLVEATRWLKAHPYAAVIHKARNYLWGRGGAPLADRAGVGRLPA